MSDLLDYYARRAAEYDRIYDKPERQEDLRQLAKLLIDWLSNRDVLEVACGTGYWTARLGLHARSIVAIDAVDEVLTLARQRCRSLAKVRFAQADALHMEQVSDRRCDGGLAAFFWSHVDKERLPAFLANFHRTLAHGSRVAICDSRFVAGSSTPISRTDSAGNTYQSRQLDDGTQYEILKNFSSPHEIRQVFAAANVEHVEIVELTYFWCARYSL